MRQESPTDHLTMGGPATYRIIVRGELDSRMASHLAGNAGEVEADEAGVLEGFLHQGASTDDKDLWRR